jgi:hypothetical protein
MPGGEKPGRLPQARTAAVPSHKARAPATLIAMRHVRVKKVDTTSARCAFCHDALDHVLAYAPVTCPSCGTLLHRDCWQDGARCPTLGCQVVPMRVSGASSSRDLGSRVRSVVSFVLARPNLVIMSVLAVTLLAFLGMIALIAAVETIDFGDGTPESTVRINEHVTRQIR